VANIVVEIVEETLVHSPLSVSGGDGVLEGWGSVRSRNDLILITGDILDEVHSQGMKNIAWVLTIDL